MNHFEKESLGMFPTPSYPQSLQWLKEHGQELIGRL